MDATRRRGLGKGLAALLPTAAPRPATPSASAATETRAEEPDSGARGYFLCDIAQIRPNAAQPRRHFSEAELASLAESIAAQGVIQPVVVRRLPAEATSPSDGARYELIAGERRWRAARQAGLDRIPAVVREATDRDALEMALVENLQREDLNPLEVAEAYRTLVEEFALTQEAIARRVGRQRSTVANHLRLLRLPAEVKEALESGAITMGHARAVLGLEDPALEVTAFKKVLAGRLSVRETERLVQHLREASARGRGRRPDPDAQAADRALARIGERLQRALGTKVEVRARGARGRIIISYFSNEELDRLLERLERES
ncbi:MAG TPA: ParB/RepB/Spo0J family partition protein [Thermodesulfobacteriota bacterium]